MTDDVSIMEASLEQLADTGVELRHGLYRRFFEANPDRVKEFLSPDATSRRMTDETLQMLYGIAAQEDWVETLIAELVATHRSYGDLKLSEYNSFIDLLVDEFEQALGARWTPACASAWGRQADQLKAMIAKAQADWDRVLPTGRPE